MTSSILKVLRLAVLFFSSINHTMGQTVIISGKVADRETGSPLSGAHINLPDHQIVVLSDSLGKFKFSVPISETINLVVTHIGYGQQIFRHPYGQDLNLNLSQASTELNHTIQVTASRRQQTTITETRSLTLLNEKEIFSTAGRTTPELLMNTAGIWLQKTNHGGGSPIIRGLTGNQIVLINDGIRMNNAIYRYGPNQYLSTIDPMTLHSIEVVRGTSSLLYGSDAIGGVVQLFHQTPEFRSSTEPFQFSGNISSRFLSSRMQQGGSIQLKGEGQHFAFTSNFSLNEFGDLVAGKGIGLQSPSGYHQLSGNIKTAFRITPRDILHVSHQNLSQSKVPRFDQVNLGGFSRYEFNPQNQSISFLRWRHLGKNRWSEKITTTAYYNTLREGLVTEKTDSNVQSTFDDRVATTGLNLEILSSPNDFWSIQTGLELLKDIVASQGEKSWLLTGTNESIRGNYADGSMLETIAAFSNQQFETDHFIFNGGVRYTRSKIKIIDSVFGDQIFAPSALVYGGGISWKATKNLFPYLSWQTGFRAPNIDDLSKFGTVEAGIFEVPAKNLKPERSAALEGGIKLATKKSALSFSGFQTDLRNIIERMPALYRGLSEYENRKVFKKENVGEAVFRGIEVETEISLQKKIKARGHFTYTYGENKTKGEPARRIPPAYGQASIHYAVSRTISFSIVWNKAGQQTRFSAGDLADKRISSRLREGVMPGWETFDLMAGYSTGRLKSQVVFRNLLNTGYSIYGSGVDGYGRHASVTLQWMF